MKRNLKTRLLSLLLCVSMIVSLLAHVTPVHSAESGAEGEEKKTTISDLTAPFRPDVEFVINGETLKSQSYRIPTMVTLDDGTIVAAADIRWNTTYDGGGLDTLVARSTDGGRSWQYTVANYLGDNGNEYNALSSTFIDPNLLVGADGHTVYMLVDLYAYGVALNGNGQQSFPTSDTGFTADGYLALSSNNRASFGYYLKDGKIWANGATEPLEGYSVDAYFNITGPNGEKGNLFCADSPFQVAKTQFLYLIKSIDGGATWSEPSLLNLRKPAGTTPKNTDEDALLVAPAGSVTTSKGVMVFPVYSYAHYTTYNSMTASYQHMGLIYSTDGVNWERTENFTELDFSSEGSVIELQNGNLRVFFRNDQSRLCYADYDLEAKKWLPYEKTEIRTNSNTQLSAITYSRTSDGKQVVLVSCPSGPTNKDGINDGNGSWRTNGKIHVFIVNEDGSMTEKKTIDQFTTPATGQLGGSIYLEEQGFFAYSALTEGGDGSVLLMYENNQFGWGAGTDDSIYFTITIKGHTADALGIKLDDPENIIVDANGNRIDSVTMGQFEKPEITAQSPFNSADVKYQWQIEYEDGKWVDIYGETSKTVKISYGMVATLLSDDGKVDIRCKSQSGTSVAYSKPITVTIEMYQPEEPDVVVSESLTTTSGEVVTVTIAGSIPEDASVQLEEAEPEGVNVGASETVMASLDISIKNADGTEWQPESGETVTVTLEASKLGLKDGDTFVVYHLHEGEVKIIGAYTVENDTVSFEVDGFSLFVFALAEMTVTTDSLQDDVEKMATINELYNDLWLVEEPSALTSYTGNWYVRAIEGVDYVADIEFKITGAYVSSVYPYGIFYKVEAADSNDLLTEVLGYNKWIFQRYQDDPVEAGTLILYDLPEETEPETPAVNITVDGELVSEIAVSVSDKVTLSAALNVEGTTTYQWQLLIPAANIWVNISGQTSAECIVNYGMVANQLDSNGQAMIRCVATVDGVEITGEAIAVNVAAAAAETYSLRSRACSGSASRAMPLAEADGAGSTTIYNVVIEYVFADGSQAANPWTGTIEAGGDYKGTIKSPIVVGYTPDKTSVELDIQNISGDLTFTVLYEAAEVKFTVIHWFQNVDDENYTEFKRLTQSGYTDSAVGAGLGLNAEEMKAEGVYVLPYDIEQKIAADGSTTINIYYDRYYFLMTFDLGGGYGVEPIYARVGTPILVGTPIRLGYAFTGWSPVVPAVMPNQNMTITAQWTAGNTTYTVAYWAENANDNGYSFLDYRVLDAVSGTMVSGTNDYTGDITGFHFDHADQNVVVKGDGSTVVNVYYKRNTYTLIFAYSGGNQICTETHANHNNCKLVCAMEAHTHSRACCSSNSHNGWNHTCNTENCRYGYEHEHGEVASCYNCGKIAHTSHAVQYGCYGLEFEGIKFGQDTSPWWSQAPAKKWLVEYDGSTFYTAAPAMPNRDLVIYGTSQSGSSTIYYYEIVNGDRTTNSVRPNYTVNTDGWTFTDEDYVVVPGFSFHSSEYGDSSWWDPVTEYYIYYTRNSYTLTFKNGSETKDAGTFLYQVDISGQYYVPTYNGDDPEGYTFAGWYTTEACVPGTEWNHEGATMPYNNLILYAKWAPVSHEVKLFITKADWEAGNQYLDTMTVQHNTTAQEPARPSNGSYNFVGWFYMEDGAEKAYDFDIPVRKDLNLYGKWVADDLATYTIKYAVENVDGTLTYIADDTKGSALAGQDKTFEAKSGTELYEGYRIGYYPETNSHSMNVLLDADNTYTFIYVPKDEVAYTVKYLEKGTEKVLFPQKNSTTREAIHTENFEFVSGYRPDAYQKRIVLSADETENVIIFWYEVDKDHAPVLVKHYLQNAAGTGYNTTNPYLTTTDLDGVINSNYNVDIITTLEGFEFAKAEASYDWGGTKTSVTITIGDSQVSAVVTQYGLLIELYYDRVECPYEFKFLEQGTDKVLADSVIGTAIFGSQVKQAAKKIPGYTCTVENQAMTIQLEDGTTAVKNVRIFYYVEQVVEIIYVPVGGGTTTPGSQTNIPVLSGTVGGSTATPSAGYKFIGWYKDQACTTPVDPSWVNGNKITPDKTKSYGTELGYESATYYAKFEEIIVSVRYEAEAGGQVSVTEESAGMATGSFLGSTATANAGYKFIGWYYGNAKVSADATYVPAISDAGKIFTAKFKEIEVTINYVVVGPTGCGTVNPTTETVKAISGNSSSTATASSNVYKFVGWYYDADCKNPVPNAWVDANGKITPQKSGDLWQAATYYAKFEYNLTSLTIKKIGYTGYETIDPNQTFVFNVKGEADGVDLTVTIHGDDEITIDGLTVGNTYTVTEETDWSWRYIFSEWEHRKNSNDTTVTVGTTNGAQITLGLDGTITFTNTRNKDQWLDGDSYKVNIFNANASSQE